MSERSCPVCTEPMTTGHLGPITLDACRLCGGVWFACGELSRTITAGPQVIRRLYSGLTPQRPAVEARHMEHKCPVCRAALATVEYGSMKGVLVEICAFCEGTWTSHTALDRLAAALEGTPTQEQATESATASYADPASTARDSEACPNCGEPNAPLAPACWACAKPLLGPAVGTCPACRGTMHRLESEGVTFNACEGCGGILTNPTRLNTLLRQPLEQLETGVLQQLERFGKGKAARPTSVPSCPKCSVTMVLTGLGKLTPAPIPTCPKCFGLFLPRGMVADILLGKRGGPAPPAAGGGVQEITCEAALRRGLDARLLAARLRHNWRAVVGYSASTGRSYFAMRFEETRRVVILLLPDQPAAAEAVTAVPSDVEWES